MTGFLIDDDAPGAWPRGTRVAKTNSKPGDSHSDGATGVVAGSVGPAADGEFAGQHGYFVRWDHDDPAVPVLVTSPRLRRLDAPA